MQPWQPDNPLEEKLFQAFTADDLKAAWTLLQAAQLALPIAAAAFTGDVPPAWPTVTTAGRTWITAYTSMESMRVGTGDTLEHAQISSLPELAAGWPDHNWGLAINPGLPIQLPLDASAVARLAAPTLIEDREAEPAARTPLMQKLLRPVEIEEMLQLGLGYVSGYCHQVLDVAHIATPEVLIDALGRKDELAELMTGEGSVNLLRWPAVGLELYRNALGGTDEASCTAVGGWLIEEPPFVGLGFAPNADQVIREYKVDGVGLPHGAEMCELTDAGTTHRRALLDIDLGRWSLITPVDDESAAADGRHG
jgi:hypothetical protein